MIIEVVEIDCSNFVKFGLANVFEFLNNLMVKGLDETVFLHFVATNQFKNFLCLVSPSVVRFYCLVIGDF